MASQELFVSQQMDAQPSGHFRRFDAFVPEHQQYSCWRRFFSLHAVPEDPGVWTALDHEKRQRVRMVIAFMLHNCNNETSYEAIIDCGLQGVWQSVMSELPVYNSNPDVRAQHGRYGELFRKMQTGCLQALWPDISQWLTDFWLADDILNPVRRRSELQLPTPLIWESLKQFNNVVYGELFRSLFVHDGIFITDAIAQVFYYFGECPVQPGVNRWWKYNIKLQDPPHVFERLRSLFHELLVLQLRDWRFAEQSSEDDTSATARALTKSRLTLLDRVISKMSVEFTTTATKSIMLNEKFIDMPRCSQFDKDGTLLPFNNGFVKIYPFVSSEFPLMAYAHNVYITDSVGYDFRMPTNAEIERCNAFLKVLFPIEDEARCFLQHLAYALIKGRVKKVFMEIFGFRNTGKSTLMRLVLAAFGNRAVRGQANLLSTPLKPDGATPGIVALSDKCLAVWSENTEVLDPAIVKMLIGEPGASQRTLFRDLQDVKLSVLPIFLTNKRATYTTPTEDIVPKHRVFTLFTILCNTEAEAAALRRQQQAYEHEGGTVIRRYGVIDPTMNTDEFAEELRYAFLWSALSVMPISMESIHVPDSIRLANKDMIDDNQFIVFIKSMLTPVDTSHKAHAFVSLSALLKKAKADKESMDDLPIAQRSKFLSVKVLAKHLLDFDEFKFCTFTDARNSPQVACRHCYPRLAHNKPSRATYYLLGYLLNGGGEEERDTFPPPSALGGGGEGHSRGME